MNAPIRLAGSSLRLPVPIVTLTALPFPGLCGVPAARDANAPRALAGDARGAGYCVSRLRRRGGVATQRPAKPFTPVRFRSAPLKESPANRELSCLRGGKRCLDVSPD